MPKQNATTDRLPPQNIEAEQSVLGSLMLGKDTIIRVADLLKPGDFYRQIHNIIFEVMLDLYEKSEPIDLLSLTSRLEDRKQIDEIGGPGYLAELVNRVPTAAHIMHYAKIVHHKKVLRELIAVSEHIAQLGFKEEEDIENILDEAEQSVFRISQKNLTQEFMPVKNALEEAFERIDKLHKGDGAMRGVPTGFYDLDNYLSGLQKSDLVILAARPSLGKTSMAMDIVRHVAVKQKIPVGIFSLEMSKHDVVDRLLAAQAGVDLWKLRTGRLSMDGLDNDLLRIQEAMSVLSESPIFIDDAASPTVLQMRTMGRRLQAEHDNLGLIVVDYLQLIQPRTNSENMVQQITEVSRSLKGLARELECPVLALSQLSRAVESRPDQIPRLSDLRESGSIEQDADVVLFIYREDKAKKDSSRPNIADILIAKHRNGPIGRAELYFNDAQASFKNLEKHFNE
ncbi:MAG: Primary replicative DNA helicase [Parcubacteria group bacterium GW2011_GWA2_43_9b]|uniref:Replicative DNA helicase n=1 Tax=Candidatus Portnoybacteria bacterium RIFCSPLOWO2_02_FULL_39_11 TaxID=1802001 RepID=A0A1G2FU67_9BACT|nr:MAG: Primary replicative DNA helicase [Parcubacteria group bacterium GW2011_GWA2_43_9b]OGZ41635.1 MAG: replicative DNA helicase [Candidatus Portnoybacteria bacterium RIFCSPLOWO2_02_FULL_39_11]